MDEIIENNKVGPAYVEALNSCSLETYEGYFEQLNAIGVLTNEDLRSIEDLPIAAKLTSHALAILSCPQCSHNAKEWAREQLHRKL